MSAIGVLLDPAGDASPPEDATLVASERAFLEHASAPRFDGKRYVIRGQALCAWVREWCEGRGYAFSHLESPGQIWRRLNPLWTDEQIHVLQQRIGLVVPPKTGEEMIAALYPEGPWWDAPGREHAARWAFWLDETSVSLSDPALPLFRTVTAKWRNALSENDAFSRSAYTLETAEQSAAFLEGWLFDGAVPDPVSIEIPDRWRNRAAARWQYAPMDEGVEAFWKRVVSGGICADLRRVASQIAYDFLKRNPSDISDGLITSLKGHLLPAMWQELHRYRPPKLPSALLPGTSPSEVLEWVSGKYLPFRQWQVLHGDAGHREQVAELAHSFADWLIVFYPEALGGGKGNDLLAITKSAQLQHPGTGVTLWVILDGLPLPDGERLLGLLGEEKRLTAVESRTYFTTLPTITCFCKPALMNGCPPEHLDISETPTPNFAAAVPLKDKTMREQAAKAMAGQVLVWSHKEPDAIYHKNQSRQTTLADVDGALQTIAERIRELMRAVPSDFELTVIVTTDHGRLLSDGVPRSHALPDGAKSEGRAAWGHPAHVPQDGLVSLSAETFRLPEGIEAWVARDDAAFVQGNGSGGTVSFPHGGLWPEEAVIPWFVFVRDAQAPSVRIRVSGSGRSGGSGALSFTFDNAGAVPITVLSVRLRSAEVNWQWEHAFNLSVGDQQQKSEGRPLDRWPTDQERERVSGTALVSLPNGATFELPAEVTLQSDALYKRGLGAEDLLDL